MKILLWISRSLHLWQWYLQMGNNCVCVCVWSHSSTYSYPYFHLLTLMYTCLSHYLYLPTVSAYSSLGIIYHRLSKSKWNWIRQPNRHPFPQFCLLVAVHCAVKLLLFPPLSPVTSLFIKIWHFCWLNLWVVERIFMLKTTKAEKL